MAKPTRPAHLEPKYVLLCGDVMRDRKPVFVGVSELLAGYGVNHLECVALLAGTGTAKNLDTLYPRAQVLMTRANQK